MKDENLQTKNNKKTEWEIEWVFRASESDIEIHTLFNPDKRYLGHIDLPSGKDVILTIKDIGFAMVENPKEGTRELERVILFEENEENSIWLKPFICNETNIKMIYYLTPYNNLKELIGKKIRIGLDKTQYNGEEVDCLRVRNIRFSTLDDKHISDEQVEEIKMLLLQQTEKTLQVILNVYKIRDLSKFPLSRLDNLKKILQKSIEQTKQMK